VRINEELMEIWPNEVCDSGKLIGMRIEQGEDINDFNLRTKGLECNYWSTYTKSRIGGVQVISLYRDPIRVDNRSLGAKN